MTSQISQIFRRGIPTGPDVDKLMAAGILPGQSIGYGQVETIIGVRCGTSRFTTVTASWRKRMFREFGTRIIARGRMFVALTADECIPQSISDITRGTRQIIRSNVYVEAIDTTQLTPADRDRHMLLQRHSSALLGHAQSVRRAIAPPKPVAPK